MKDDEVVVFDKRNPTKVEGRAIVKEVSGTTVKVRMLNGEELFIEPRRLRKIGTLKAEPDTDSVLEPPVVLIVPDPPEVEGSDSESYRDKVREIAGKARARRGGDIPRGRFIDPRGIMESIQDAGGPFVGKKKMESILTLMSEEIGITPIDADVMGVHLRLFIHSDSTIEEAISDQPNTGSVENIEILSPTSLRVLSVTEVRIRETAIRQEAAVAAEATEAESFAAFCKTVDGLASSMGTVTTTAIFDLLPKSEGEKDDADGKFRKKIAAALRQIGFLQQISFVAGKKIKTFSRPEPKMSFWEASEARRAAAQLWVAREEELRMERDRLDHEMQVEEDRETSMESSMSSTDNAAAQPLPGTGTGTGTGMNLVAPISPEDGAEPDENETEEWSFPGVSPAEAEASAEAAASNKGMEDGVPVEWTERITTFLQGDGAGMTFVSLDWLILEAVGEIPNTVHLAARRHLSHHMVSVGLIQVKYGRLERKVFHVDGEPPSDEEMEAHFVKVDSGIREALGIKVSDAPPWMSEEQKDNLSCLEHAVLLLNEKGVHSRSDLFPGHSNHDWQRRVILALSSKGLIATHGKFRTAVYSGVIPLIEQALDRAFLLDVFWHRESRGGPGPEPDHGADEEHGDDGDDGVVHHTVESLSAAITEIMAVLEDHANTIRSLKKRVKSLEGQGQKDG